MSKQNSRGSHWRLMQGIGLVALLFVEWWLQSREYF